MTRLDFHSISAILLNHLKAADISQIDYMYFLFASFINDENSTSIDNVNHHATKLEALKDFTETQLTPLIEADYQKQQENARSQPFPKFLDKK